MVIMLIKKKKKCYLVSVAVVLVDADITLLTVEAVNTTEAEETVEVFRSCFS